MPGELRAQRLTHEGTVVISTRSSRIARRIALAALAVGLTVTGTGCSSQAGAAAVIDGRRIPVSDVQQATTQIAAFTGQEVAPSQVLFFLLLGPRLVNAAAANGVGVSDAQARQELATKVADPSDAAVARDPSMLATVKKNFRAVSSRRWGGDVTTISRAMCSGMRWTSNWMSADCRTMSSADSCRRRMPATAS